MSFEFSQYLDRFLNWWSSGLCLALPKKWRDRQKSLSRFLIAHTEQHSIQFEYHADDTKRSEIRCPLSQTATHEEPGLREWLSHIPNAEALPFIVRVPADQILTKRVRYPRSTQNSLREVIGFDIERQIPFSREDVYFDFLVQNTLDSDEFIDVDLLVFRKQDLKSEYVVIEQCGLIPTIIDSEEFTFFDHHINFLENTRSTHTEHSPYRAAFALLLLWLLIIGLIPGKLAIEANSIADQLTSQADSARAELRSLEPLKLKYAELVSKANYFHELEAGHVSPIDLLLEVTRLLDDDTSLRIFDLKDDRLTIQGESSNASEIPVKFENSPLLSSPQFNSPVTRDNRSGKDRFNITVIVKSRDPS
ncbi:MAG: pilus assembly protein PilM [Proteobacteria bacterium]|nr:pilus assembly protein PilM [Pseudomonadota bacterium]